MSQENIVQRKIHARSLIQRLIKTYVRPHTGLILKSFAYMGISAAMTGALAALMQPIIDQVFKASSTSKLFEVALMVLGAFFIRGFTSYLSAVQMNHVGQRIVADAQKSLYAHLVRSDLAWLHGTTSGQLISRVINDVQVMRLAVGECLAGIGSSALTLVFLIGVMFWRDWLLASISFIAFPSAAYFVSRISKRLRRVWGQTQEALATLSSVMSQTFTASRQVKAYGTEDYEERRIGKMIEELFNLSTKSFRVANSTTPVNEGLSGIAIVTVIVYGGFQVMEGHSTAGALFSFITAFLLAYEPIKKLTKLNAQLQAGLAAADRVFAVLDLKPEIVDAPDAHELQLTSPTVKLENVSFGYKADEPVLHGITLEAKAGQTIALVGPSGAGKSSVLNLVLRLYDVNGGRVLVDGQDVRQITLKSLRRNFALVSQEVAIFDDTIRANIRYGTEGASDADVEAAAKAAYAHDFIIGLPEGYDTMVGEHGTRLSGGQRQRLSIARAMLRQSPILLLDEATSALDSESERAVQAALSKLQEGRTTIAIAHRLSTICDADVIYVLDKGHVAEQGKHAELLALGGIYARLWRLQAGETIAA